jgi:hypothetical protein
MGAINGGARFALSTIRISPRPADFGDEDDP